MGNISEIEYVPATAGTFLVDVRFVFSSYQIFSNIFYKFSKSGKRIESLPQALIFESLYLCKLMIFLTMIFVIKYQRFRPLGCKNIGIRKFCVSIFLTDN